MLFPYAEGGNLKSYLVGHEPPTLTKDFVLWLLTQMRDLASAVQHIHNFATTTKLTKGGPTSRASTPSPAQRLRNKNAHRGSHYDLKLDNILLFSHSSPKRPVWKITDLGTAQINEISSGSSTSEGTIRVRDMRGDPEYGAPDAVLQGWSSRAYDIWSLGCIYLEVLVWVFGNGPEELIQFQYDRLEQPEPQGNQSGAFWYRDRDSVQLKPKVREKMDELRDKCRQLGLFEDLFQLTADMLALVAKERPNAPTVHNEMSVILQQAEHDLVAEDFYLNLVREITKTPTIDRQSSRPTSIDERPLEVAPKRSDEQELALVDTGHSRALSKPAINNSPSLVVPGRVSYLSPIIPITYSPQRSRIPSIQVHRPSGDVDSDADSVFDEVSPEGWRQPGTRDII